MSEQENNVQEVQQTNEQPQEVDLVTKVAGFQTEQEPQPETQPQPQEEKFNTNDLQAEIDKISDPNLKAQMEGLRKSLQRGYNDKFQTLAEMKKEMLKSNQWTEARVQELLNDQNFVNAAQQLMQHQNPPNSGKSDEEWSALSDSEKQKIMALQNEIAILKQQNLDATNAQLDKELKNRYPNYDSQAVAQLKDDLMNNRIQATNEHLWKVLDYENGLKRAYELGKRESNQVKMDKLNNSSFTPSSVDTQKEPRLTKDGEQVPSLTEIYKFQKQQRIQQQYKQ